MKCPVCDLENSAMNCTQCGFDASRDYTLHPTFGPVGRVPSVSAKKKQWLDSQKKPLSSSDGPQFVDYRKMVSDAATADEQYRQSREHQLLRSLQAANEQISQLKQDKRKKQTRIESLQKEMKTLTDYLLPENQALKERILTLVQQNNALIKESVQMEDKVRDLVTKLVEAERLHQDALAHISRLEKENKVLTDDLKQSEDYRKASSRQYGNEVLKVKERDAKIAKLESQLETVQSRTAELEAERSKGILARLFNR